MDAPVLGRSALSGRIPVSVVTGFLGSGKTTLVNKLLIEPGGLALHDTATL